MKCRKYQIEVTACSRQPAFFNEEICRKCADEKVIEIDPRKADTIPVMRQRLGINSGMTKEEALQKFSQWKSDKRTCARCEEGGGNQYWDYCPYRRICEEAERTDKEVTVEIVNHTNQYLKEA